MWFQCTLDLEGRRTVQTCNKERVLERHTSSSVRVLGRWDVIWGGHDSQPVAGTAHQNQPPAPSWWNGGLFHRKARRIARQWGRPRWWAWGSQDHSCQPASAIHLLRAESVWLATSWDLTNGANVLVVEDKQRTRSSAIHTEPKTPRVIKNESIHPAPGCLLCLLCNQPSTNAYHTSCALQLLTNVWPEWSSYNNKGIMKLRANPVTLTSRPSSTVSNKRWGVN